MVADEPKHTTDTPDEASLASTETAAETGVVEGLREAAAANPPESGEAAGAESGNNDEEAVVAPKPVEKEVAQWADDDDLSELDAEYNEEDEDYSNVADVAPLEEATEEEAQPDAEIEERPLDWYILKVQSNREDSIADALKRRVKVAGLEEYFKQIIVPTEMVTEFKGGKKKVVKRKLYPGYIVVHMIINDETWFLVRETPGIGDFTGSAGRPTPMLPQEVARIVQKDEDVTTEEPKLQIPVNIGDRVKINEGTFENFEGDVDSIDVTNGRVTVMINIFGRSTPVELEYWQIETL